MRASFRYQKCCPLKRLIDMEKIRLVVLVDMPETTRHERKVKRECMDSLFKLGFSQLQQGVFTRLSDGRSNAALQVARLASLAPSCGTVRIFEMTELQFRKSVLLAGSEDAQESEVDSVLDIFL